MTTDSSQGSTTRLSNELLLQILIHLSVPDLLKWRELARDFRDFIDDSSALQYEIDLLLAGLEDDWSSHLTASEKRIQLRKYKALRDSLHPTLLSRNRVSFRGDEKSWDLQAGSLVLMRQGGLVFTQFPSPTSRNAQRVWELQLNWQDFIVLDPPQDLLILFRLENGRFLAGVLSMATGERHALAMKSTFYVPAPSGADIDHLHLEYNVFESYLSVLCTYTDHDLENYREVLWVANWRDGNILMSRYNQNIKAHCVLDARRIMIATTPPNLRAIRLSIVNFTSNSDEPIHLLLPQFSDGVSWYNVAINSNPQLRSTTLSDVPGSLPFYLSRKDRVIVLEFSINFEDMNYQRTLILPSWSLDQALSQASNVRHCDSREVPWEEWGPQSTRFIKERPSTSEGQTADSSATGTRYVTISGGFAVLNDFNRFAFRHTTTSDLIDNPLISLVSGSSTVELPFFKRPITTSVPYRRFVTSLPVSATQRVGVAEDYLVLTESDPWSLEILSL